MGNEIKQEELPDNRPSENQDVQENKPPKTHLQYGLIAGLVLIALFVIYYVMGWAFQQGLKSWLPSIIFMLIVIIAQFTHSKALNGNITYGNLFAQGFKTTAVATCVYLVFMIIFLLLDPSYKEKMIEVSRQAMAERGMAADQIKAALAMTEKFFMVSVISGIVIGELVAGLIASLIGAALAPKKPKSQLQPLS